MKPCMSFYQGIGWSNNDLTARKHVIYMIFHTQNELLLLTGSNTQFVRTIVLYTYWGAIV